MGQYLHLGMEFALAIAVSVGGGYWLDTKLHTLPLFLIVGLALGMTSGFLTIYRAIYSPKKDESERR